MKSIRSYSVKKLITQSIYLMKSDYQLLDETSLFFLNRKYKDCYIFEIVKKESLKMFMEN